MTRKALIVEDNDGVAGLLTGVARELSFEVTRYKLGTEAIMSFASGLPDLVFLDLVLGDLDGFQVANALRGTPGGESIPIVVVSGVYKKLPDPFTERVKPYFVTKPFDQAGVTTLVAGLFDAADAAKGIRRGHFTRSSPAELFVKLCEERATGQLEITANEVRRRLSLQGGGIRFAQSNVRSESIGGMQVAAGTLKQAAFDKALAHARSARVPLHEALVQTGAMTQEQAAAALREQTSEVTFHALSMIGADWLFQLGPVDATPDARKHPLVGIVKHAKRTVSPEDAKEAIWAREDGRLVKTPLLERELFALRGAAPGETVTTLASGKATLHDVGGRARPEDLPFLWALLSSGLVTVEVEKAAAAPAVPAAQLAQEQDLDKGVRFTPEEERARKLIFAERERAKSLNHYEFLGVSNNAPVEDCRRAYIELARRFHTDSYSGLNLGSAAPILGDLFSRAKEAVDTVSADASRAEYAVYLDRKAKGLPTDVNAILRAEGAFQKAEVFAKKGKYADALPLLRDAVALNHAEPEFHAWLGYSLYKVQGAPAVDEARAEIEKAVSDSPNLAVGWLLLGLLARDTGDVASAEKHLVKAAALDDKNDMITRELRALRSRKEKDAASGKSFFGKLFGK